MKKLLSLIFAAACVITAKAQPNATPAWQANIAGVAEAADVYRTAPVAITADGDVYATGRFNQTIAEGDIFLEPVAQSAYLMKYDKEGTALWAVAVAGSATIKSVATDANENVYIAGTMADEVVFNTNAGEAVTLKGAMDEFGDYVTAQSTSFIAKYDANGKLLVAKAFVPARHPDVNGLKDDVNGPYYFPEEDGSFKINSIAVEGENVYVSANYSGTTNVEGVTFTGSLVNIFFYMIDNLRSAAVFSLDTNLENAKVIADFNSAEAMTYDLAYNTTSCDFTVENGTVYVGAVCQGKINMTTPTGTENFDFYMSGEGDTEYGHVIAAINGNETSVKIYKAPANSNTSKESIEALQVYGDQLYIGGLFNNVFAFDNVFTATNSADIYVAVLDKKTLERNIAYISGYDETGTNKLQENFTSLLVADGVIYLNGYTDSLSGHVIKDNLSFVIDETGISASTSETLITGAAANNSTLVFAGVNADNKSTVDYYTGIIADNEQEPSLDAPTWQESIAGVTEVADVYRTAPVAITADGDVYATGRFNQTIAEGDIFLEPVAQSAYLMKYDKEGTALWAVAVAGSATIKSVATDANENVYIAGTMADEVVFNTNAGEAVTLKGAMDEFGDYVTAQSTSFIAKYDANGKLLVAKAFVPARHPDVNGLKDDVNGPYYFPEEDGSFKINSIAVEGENVYVSANYSGTTNVEGVTFTGSLVNIFFYMIDNLRSAAVFSLDTNLENAKVIADFNSAEAMTYDLAYNTTSCDFTVENGTVYVGAVCQGKINMTTPTGTENFDFYMSGEGDTEYGHVIAAINGNETSVKIYKAPANSNTSKESIEALQVYGDQLYIGGLFNNVFAFDNVFTATNSADIYVAVLDKKTLERNIAYISGYDETGTNKLQENFTSLLVADGVIYLNGYTDSLSGHVIKDNLSFVIDETGISASTSETLTTGAAANKTALVFAGVDAEGKNTIKYYADFLTSINDTKESQDFNVKYANGVLTFGETANVELWSVQGYVIDRAWSVNTLNVNNLPNGCYIAKITTSNGVNSYKFIKK